MNISIVTDCSEFRFEITKISIKKGLMKPTFYMLEIQ